MKLSAMYKLSSLKQQPKHKDIWLIMMYSQPQMKVTFLLRRRVPFTAQPLVKRRHCISSGWKNQEIKKLKEKKTSMKF